MLVAGSGIAGMSAAIEVGRSRASVLVLEKDTVIGGNSRWAGGFDLEAYSVEKMRAENPEGDPVLQRVLVERFADSIRWLEECGVELEERRPGRFEYRLRSIGPFGAQAFLALQSTLEKVGGRVALETPFLRLVTDAGGAVVGATAVGPDGPFRVRAAAVIVATGSFGRSVELKARYIGPAGERTGHYGTDHHYGDGLLAALEVGAAVSTGISIPTGGCVYPPPFEPLAGRNRLGVDLESTDPVPAGVQTLHLRPTPAWGEQPCVLVNLNGERYVDESGRYTVSGWKTTCQSLGVGFCLFDRRSYNEIGPTLELAKAQGAVVYEADTLEELARQLARWKVTDSYSEGIDAKRLLATIAEFNEAVIAGRANELHPPRSANALTLEQAPFFGVPVVQGVVDMAGGIKIDREARVLDRSGRPIPGLYAAGADAGRAYTVEHGGLSFGLIFGRVAGATAAALAAQS